VLRSKNDASPPGHPAHRVRAARPSVDGGPTDPEEELDAGLTPRDGGVDAADAAPAPGCAVVGVDAGAPASVALGTLTYIASAGAYLGRDAGGLYAMYALCTHTIGNMSIGPAQLTCLVHGAKFSYTGEVLQGPATTPLPHFSVCLNSKGNVAIDSKVIVPASTRLVA